MPIAFVHGMTNLTLASEEDDFSRGYSLKPSPRNSAKNLKISSEAQKVLLSFNPHKVGFGILPWPGTDQPAPVSDTVALAMQYLVEGPNHKAGGETK